jgi:hypothetical protein
VKEQDGSKGSNSEKGMHFTEILLTFKADPFLRQEK